MCSHVVKGNRLYRSTWFATTEVGVASARESEPTASLETPRHGSEVEKPGVAAASLCQRRPPAPQPPQTGLHLWLLTSAATEVAIVDAKVVCTRLVPGINQFTDGSLSGGPVDFLQRISQ